MIVVPVAAIVFFTSTKITNTDTGRQAMSFAASGAARTVAFLLGCFALASPDTSG